MQPIKGVRLLRQGAEIINYSQMLFRKFNNWLLRNKRPWGPCRFAAVGTALNLV